MYETLKLEMENAIGILTLQVPKKMNAMTKKMREELLHFWRSLQNNQKECRVVIITGSGGAFSSGLDIDETDDESGPFCKRDIKGLYTFQDEVAELILMMRRAPQPIIAAVRGYAAGGGFSLVMAADIRIADPTAKFVASYINIGLSGADMGSSFFLPREVNLGFAAEYLFTGEVMEADAAQRAGFVNYVVPPNELIPKAQEIAKKMVAKSVIGLRMTKEAINQNIGSASLESALNLENRNQVICFGAGLMESPFRRRGDK